MQWPWPRWVLAMRSSSSQVAADAGGDGLLPGVQVHEAGHGAGGEVAVQPVLELADRAHGAVGPQQDLPVEGRGRSLSDGRHGRASLFDGLMAGASLLRRG